MKKYLLFTLVILMLSCTVLFASCSLVVGEIGNVSYDGTRITWQAAKNATEYQISINDGEPQTVRSTFLEYNANNKDFNVTITPMGGQLDLGDKMQRTVYFKYLGELQEIYIGEDGTISWDGISGATAYAVDINGTQITTYDTYYSQFETNKRLSVKVKPIVEGDNSYYSFWSKSITLTKLKSVSGDSISYDGSVLRWTGTNAAEYAIYIDQNYYDTVSSTSYLYSSGNASFEVAIQALGQNDKQTYNADISEAKSFIFLSAIKEITVENGILRWEEIPNATGYEVKINGTIYNVSKNEYTKLNTGVSQDIEVKPIVQDKTYFSDWSSTKTVYLLPSPVSSWNANLSLDGEANNNFTWNGVNKAGGYTVRLTDTNGQVIIQDYAESQRAFAYEYLDIGKYTVEVKANASGEPGVFDSAYSEPFNVIRLAPPEPDGKDYIISNPGNLADGFKVNFIKANYASQSQLYQDGNEIPGLITEGGQFDVKGIVADNVSERQEISYLIRSKGRYDMNTRTAYLDSLSTQSLSFIITILPMPESSTMNGYNFEWSQVTGGNGYVVSVGSTQYTSSLTNYSLEILQSGSYQVQVCAKGNGKEILASNYTAAIQVVRLEAPYNIRIGTAENAEGVLSWERVDYAQSYDAYLDNNQNPISAEERDNMNRLISTKGTTVHMRAVANYYNPQNTIYYMTSPSSQTYQFTKLETPTFGEISFTNSEFIWRAPGNIADGNYTPTYEVYNQSRLKYNGEKNGTTMKIDWLEGEQTYTFYVKAVGDGINYINSELSDPITIYKLATPVLNIVNNRYEWSNVNSANSYTIYIDGVRVTDEIHVTGNTYYFSPNFTQLKDYIVELYALGDGGRTTIDSNPYVFTQKTKQLQCPEFSFAYSHSEYNTSGTLNVTITKTVEYSTGYSYNIAGITINSTQTFCSHNPNTTGKFQAAVYALGGGFDASNNYYLNSSVVGGNSSYEISLLSPPNQSSIQLSLDGVITWATVSEANGYDVQISINGGEYLTVYTASPSYIISLNDVQNLVIRVRAKGGTSTEITSSWVERIFSNIG